MIWLTWRQFRLQAAAVFGTLATIGVFLAISGPRIADDYSSGLADCTPRGSCDDYLHEFVTAHQNVFFSIALIVLVLPGLIGLFWGAPLVTRELEAGTQKLVWNQSVTRARWLAWKLALPVLVAMAAGGLASLMVGWWSRTMDIAAHDRFPRLSPVLFDARGVAPIGYAAFGFVLGVAIGVVVRRPLPAMVLVLVAFLFVQIAEPRLLRPHLIPPVHKTTAITQDTFAGFTIRGNRLYVEVKAGGKGAWVLANQTVNAAGRPVDGLPPAIANGPCAAKATAGQAVSDGQSVARAPGIAPECFAAIERAGYRQRVTYQPAERFWRLQWYETGVFICLALALSAFCLRRVQRLT